MSESEPEPSVAGEVRDVGPDPVWGVVIGAFGLVNMAVAGAITQHLWFNVGEAFMMLGAAVFLGSVLLTHVKQFGWPTLAEIRARLTSPAASTKPRDASGRP
jgi:hypothetical protein